ncbi:MAG: DUF2127 domain-containing protein [Theionarchaea archaeon]|nr:DUF2127 domain-containing protein [Theionarchaea archaeon]MBU6999940.1 DUF2127 domain-containing protein [Theionarchaea archaeon]MBU7020130.1 DUF2127 domain-containing protein [Theionarchaea archaeon]MBU7035823.1 DUF2127 domain-containing protein [Theionarchaea archaeon]MBU7041424.1 DUF2127 domain-containing protein [Theionarchaea archaeon]
MKPNQKDLEIPKKGKGVVFVALLNFLQASGRLLFAVAGLSGGIDQFLDVPVSEATTLVLHVMFFSLGICGLPAAYGLWRGKRWGFWAILLVSVVTILFDIWGYTIQKTAAIGFFVPVISIGYLYLERLRVLKEKM